MTWNNPNKYQFNEAAIKVYAPPRSGVYALYTGQQWVYVGESADIQARLLQHLGCHSPCISRMSPTTFSSELVPAHQRVARRHRLILELRPLCNERVG